MSADSDYGPKAQYLSEDDGPEDWNHSKCVCHRCGKRDVVENGQIYDCVHCDWWKPIDAS